MAYEDFSTYTEVDPNSRLTVTSSKVDAVNLKRGDGKTYVYKDYGAGHFTDYEFLVTGYCSEAQKDATYGAYLGILDIGNTIPPFPDDGLNEGERLTFFNDITHDPLVIVLYELVGNTYDLYAASLNTLYYFKMKRLDDDVYAYIYSDASRTTLLDTLSEVTTNTASRYISIGRGGGSGTGTTLEASGYVENLDLQESEAVQAPMQNAIPAVMALLMN